MLANDRYNKILDILERDGSVKTSKLVELLGISLETVRRDLDFLEKQGELQKVHGGAILKNKEGTNLTYSLREIKNTEEKKEIANLALNYIKEGETIALNSSTTNVEIAKLIKNRYSSLTVVTNSLRIAEELADQKSINLILAGGVYNKNEFAFLGEITSNFLDKFSVDKSFVSVGGISLKRGITDFLMDEVLVERKMIEIGEKAIILADSSKIDSNSLIKICEMKDINFILTDSKLSDDIKQKYKDENINIINS
ncbi:DeoR/GlpR family DNA-binding transcription regulator [Fusobacterium sp.]|uniref:DeoR/GlpR family DNA-binding transcription regulator n=1 Tax=Fusobacterium sp. TaxID=68766 RepID=UPI002606DF69|nr:DeoR/GlpR family DNA-binding transcription regulator [Fusobacterium sp.]